MLFYRRVTRHLGVFSQIFPRHRCFASRVINFKPLKIVSTQIRGQTLPSPPSGHPHPSPSSGHLPPIILAVKLSPLRPAFILLAGGQPHPSPPSGHLPPILLAVKLSPLRPAVILHPFWRPTSPFPTQRSSSTHPASGHTLPSSRRLETRDEIREMGNGRRETGGG